MVIKLIIVVLEALIVISAADVSVLLFKMCSLETNYFVW